MEELNQLLNSVIIPEMIPIKQYFETKVISQNQIQKTVKTLLKEQSQNWKPGMKIAITAGSRGICHFHLILKTIAEAVKEKNCFPFIVPAMGSHGGATAKGQKQLLEGYGITEEYCGCPILSSMETIEIGKTEDGEPVFLDKNAAKADGIIVACRIKPHTAFRGTFESGILKMLVIGLGKQKGADQCHKDGFEKIAEKIQKYGRVILENAPILCAVSVIENAFDETGEIEVIAAKDIWKQEPLLLKKAKEAMPKIWLKSCDILIVDEIGKNYSGEGMDPNITGTFLTPYASGGIQSQRVVVLGISEEAHGNGFGIGTADCTTKKVFQQLDLNAMYINGLTSTVLAGAKLPCIFPNDKLAIQAAIKTCVGIQPEGIRIVRIANTLQLEHIFVSVAYQKEIEGNKNLEVIGKPVPMGFDIDGNLL